MFDLNAFEGIYLYRPMVDFRKQIDGLSGVVQDKMELNPLGKFLFLFCNRRRDKIKILYWDRTGFALWYKKLELERWSWPRKLEEETVTLTVRQLEWLLEGIDPWKIRPHKDLQFSDAG